MIAAAGARALDAPGGDVLSAGTVESAAAQTVLVPVMPTWRAQLAYHAEDGAPVQAGDVVVRFDAAELEARRRELDDDVFVADAEHRRQRLLIDVELATATAAHARAVAEARIAAMEAEVPARFIGAAAHALRQIDARARQAAVDDASALVEHLRKRRREQDEQARARRAYLGMLLSEVQQRLGALEVRAERAGTFLIAHHPFQGTKFTVGETLRSSTVVGTVIGAGDARIRAWIHESDRARVSPASTLTVRFDAYPGVSVPATLAEIGDALESKPSWGLARYYPAVVQLAGDLPGDVQLLAGMSVLVISRN